MSALKTGARSYRFLFSIEKNFSADLTKMLVRARKYAKAEEAVASRRGRAEQASKKKKKHREERGRPRSLSPRRAKNLPRLKSPLRPRGLLRPRSPSRPKSPPRPRISNGRYESYTPLNAPRTEILMEIEGREYFRPPPPMRDTRAWRNPRKYCRFHRDYSHDTEDCFQLRDEIEALIRRGVLNRFVRNRCEEKRPIEDAVQPGEPCPNKPVAGVISTIGRGPPIGEPVERLLPKRPVSQRPFLSRTGIWRESRLPTTMQWSSP
ncbi:uncharacterized protein LOC120111480 [Phoenix dactylifera]|uniref:Uncharacterized protein LOC120111480 n=1 Tax=Phoenix dactylifera TaxID=42345 RepID=A0A8B9AMC7_PHODC|nr:uncharacterized protein LOC120111480 [Phoenix dactylifera]